MQCNRPASMWMVIDSIVKPRLSAQTSFRPADSLWVEEMGWGKMKSSSDIVQLHCTVNDYSLCSVFLLDTAEWHSLVILLNFIKSWYYLLSISYYECITYFTIEIFEIEGQASPDAELWVLFKVDMVVIYRLDKWTCDWKMGKWDTKRESERLSHLWMYP